MTLGSDEPTTKAAEISFLGGTISSASHGLDIDTAMLSTNSMAAEASHIIYCIAVGVMCS